jgi:hypothetical protein
MRHLLLNLNPARHGSCQTKRRGLAPSRQRHLGHDSGKKRLCDTLWVGTVTYRERPSENLPD